ncbi:MAG: gamma carbonic anhydrase family protein [Ferrovibrionaceae bacterium]
MLIEHLGHRPQVDPAAWVAPDATLCGNVRLGPGSRVMHGARLIAEGGTITIGAHCIVMENAVLRAAARHPCSLGDNVLIGPNTHVVGATIEDGVFIATGAALFHGSHVGRGCEVRINGTVHLKTRLTPGTVVPIGWIACGDPAELFSPDRHDELWERQRPLNFPQTVYGLDRDTPEMMKAITQGLSARLGSHRDDRIL